MNDGYEDLVTEYDDDDGEEYGPQPRWWSPTSLLTSGASAVTAFTLAVAGTMGFVGYPVAEAIVGHGGSEELRERAIVNGMVVLLLLVAAVWLSHRVFLADDAERPAWSRHLAGSSVVIAAIGTVLARVTIVASLFQDPDFPPTFP